MNILQYEPNVKYELCLFACKKQFDTCMSRCVYLFPNGKPLNIERRNRTCTLIFNNCKLYCITINNST